MINKLPPITIITATFNCAEALAKTAFSIREQDYPRIQWIVVDGLSSDSTIKVIKENEDIICTWISEKDSGIYDAWNKASKYISGEWVLFFGAGDTFFHSKVLRNFFNSLSDIDLVSNIILYGSTCLVDCNDKVRYIDKKESLNFWEFGRPALPNHQSVFHSMRLFVVSNPFDSKYKIAGDTKFLLNALTKGNFKYVDMVISKMVDDGVSNNPSNLIITRLEIKKICLELDIDVPIIQLFKADFRTYFYFFIIKLLPNKIRVGIKYILDFKRSIN